MLYSRDYTLGLTEEENIEYKNVTGRDYHEKRTHGFGTVNNPSKYPKAARMCRTLFPNNFLDFIEIRDGDKIKDSNEKFLALLDGTTTTERDILNYIKTTESYHIIGSIIRGCQLHTGHHGAFLFPEFKIGNTYIADYLLCGVSSGGYQFIFIELENPSGNITLKNGDLGFEFRDGISQLKEWKRMLQSNYPAFTETIKKSKNPHMDLPDEFYSLDLSRFHYVVIAGRRSDFTDLTYRLQRECKQSEDINVFHYDNLYDFSNLLLGQVTY